jgi:multidrug efflux pump subunit AcrA (membrane-fusion protein)
MATTVVTSRNKPRRRWYWIVGIIALVVGTFLAVPFFLGDRLPLRPGASSSTPQTLTATPQPYTLTVSGSGTLQAVQSRELAPEVTGVVATVIEEGTRVRAGDVLVQLDTDTFERSVRDA